MTVPNPMADPVDPLARSTFTVHGSVVTQDGHPLADSRVEVRDISTGIVVASGYTGLRGTFEVPNLTRGSYEITANHGISEASQRISPDGMDVSFELRMPHTSSGIGKGDTVSVAQMEVPGKAKHELEQARKDIQKHKTDSAKKHLAKALKIYPMYSDALTTRALMSMDDGNNNAALDDLDLAIKSDPNNATAYTAIAAAYNSEKKFDDALRSVDRAIPLNPTSWQAYFERSKAQLGKGQFDAALASITKAEGLTAKPFSPIYLVKGHALLGMKEYSAAIGQFEKYLSQNDSAAYKADAQEQLKEARAFVASQSLAKR